MARMAARATQEALSDLLKHVVETGETVLVRRGRRDLAAVIPMADLRRYRRLLRAWEDRYWSHAGRVALARFEASGEQPTGIAPGACGSRLRDPVHHPRG